MVLLISNFFNTIVDLIILVTNILDPQRGTNKHERVLIMQGGGSLGAYECGVYKALVKHNIRFDVVAGTSIGAVNAAIIVGSKDSDS